MASHKSDPLFLHPIARTACRPGALTELEDLDGIFGEHSKAALQALIGTTERTPDAWEKLYTKYGPIESLTAFQQYDWIPAVT